MRDVRALIVGPSTADHLSLRPARRLYPEAPDYWDGNWLKVEVEVRVGAFRGGFEADLRADQFAAFRDELRALNDSLHGEAALKTLEGWVSVRVVADRLGHLELSAHLVTSRISRCSVA